MSKPPKFNPTTIAYLEKLDKPILEAAKAIYEFTDTAEIEEIFFILQAVRTDRKRNGPDEGIKSMLDKFLVMQKLIHGEAVTEGKAGFRRYMEEMEENAKRMMERQRREVDEEIRMRSQYTRIGKQARVEFLAFVERYRSEPSAKGFTPTEADIKLTKQLVTTHGDGFQLYKSGWFTPVWKFRDISKVDALVKRIEGCSNEDAGCLIERNESFYGRFMSRRYHQGFHESF
ncbi:hypothetical protein D3C72_229740 [compost metagenome]